MSAEAVLALGQLARQAGDVVVCTDADLGGVRIAEQVLNTAPAAQIIDIGAWPHEPRRKWKPRRSARLVCAPPRLGSPAGSTRPVWRAAIRSNRNSLQSTPSTTSSAHKDAGAERHRSYDDGLAVHDQPASSRALTSGPAGEAHAARGQNRRRSSPRGRFARRAERARRLFRPAETSDDLLPNSTSLVSRPAPRRPPPCTRSLRSVPYRPRPIPRSRTQCGRSKPHPRPGKGVF